MRVDADNDDDIFEEMGFMFDNALPKSRRLFRFVNDITVAVRLVDDNPGAVQSGHYVWPAAPALCSYLINIWPSLPHGMVLELGAGCGLAGLVAAKLPGTSAVLFTDHDAGVLDLVKESIAEQDGGSADVPDHKTTRTTAAPAACARLPWGPVGKAEHAALADALASIGKKGSGRRRPWNGDMTRGRGGEVESNDTESEVVDSNNAVSFDLLIASDVIYSVSVVEPLFETVGALLAGEGGASELRSHRQGQQEGIELGERVNQGAGEEEGPRQSQEPLMSASLPLNNDCAATVKTSAAAGSMDCSVARDKRTGTEPVVCPRLPTPPRTAPRLEAPSNANPRRTTSSGLEASSRYFSYHMSAHGPIATPAPLFVMSQSFVYEVETEEAITRACAQRGLLREVVWDELDCVAGGGSSSSSSGGDGCAENPEILREDGSRGHTGDADNSGALSSEGSHRVRANSAGAEGEKDNGHRLDSAGGGSCEGSGEEAVQRAGTKLQLFWRA